MKRYGKNLHEITLDDGNEVAMLSDLHWDNPKCNRTLLKKHLDYCLKKNMPVVINGDLFCVMQGKGDRRGNKSDIRPEHNNSHYLDSVVNTAVEWFSPYADILKVIGYGNHETSIIKYQETDVLQRFVDLLNLKCHSHVQTGGYGGWIVFRIMHDKKLFPFRLKYFHGSGGGGVVTKGALNLTRALEMYENMDVFTLGHIHENSSRHDVRDTIEHSPKLGYRVVQKTIHLMITGTYKEEYEDGSKGWHIERGAPVKPLGGRIMKFLLHTDRTDGGSVIKKDVISHRFI